MRILWLACLFLFSLLESQAEEKWLRYVFPKKKEVSPLFTGSVVQLGEASSLSTHFQEQTTGGLIHFGEAPSQYWSSSYQLLYRLHLTSTMDLEYSPQLGLGSQIHWSEKELQTVGDYFDRKQTVRLSWVPFSRWKFNTSVNNVRRTLFQNERETDRDTFGLDTTFSATRWTTLRLAQKVEESHDLGSNQRQSRQSTEAEWNQRLGDSPFRFRLSAGWEGLRQFSGQSESLVYAPRTEGVFSFAPVDSSLFSVGLRLRSSIDHGDQRTNDTRAVFSEWNQSIQSKVDFRIQALYENTDETQSGQVTLKRDRAQFTVGPRLKFNENLDARMEYQISDEQNKLNNALDRSEQRVSFSIQGRF